MYQLLLLFNSILITSANQVFKLDDNVNSNFVYKLCTSNNNSCPHFLICDKFERICECKPNFECMNETSSLMELYTMTILFVASCLVLILLGFLLFVVKKSHCPTSVSNSESNANVVPIRQTEPNFAHCDSRNFIKPPSYEESIVISGL